MSCKRIYAQIYVKDGSAFKSFEANEKISDSGDIIEVAETFENRGADGIIIYDLSDDDVSHERTILAIRGITAKLDIPVIAGGNVKRLEDIKKYLYAGCSMAIVEKGAKDPVNGKDLTESCVERFGKEKICIRQKKGELYLDGHCGEQYIVTMSESDSASELLKKDDITGICSKAYNNPDFDFYAEKIKCKEEGVDDIKTIEPEMDFEKLKTNEAGLIPVIVQDYKTDEVLMMAWMNRESFEKTYKTGIMSYFSRSRNELWVKGETSGHYQYLRSMHVDCDEDTLLAKVKQVGAACHTGSRSCFYREILSKDYGETNPLKIFSEVMDVINDRKKNPKKGSYTTYLFEQGIDKVLKKCGEEAAEVIIAAKNPDKEEIKYEIADYLYHVMVLMSMKDITWEDIIKELANR